MATTLTELTGLPTSSGYYFIRKVLEDNYMYLVKVRGTSPFLDIETVIILPHRTNTAANDSLDYINAHLAEYKWSDSVVLEGLILAP